MASLNSGKKQSGQISHRRQGSDNRLVIICGAISVLLFAFSFYGGSSSPLEVLRSGFSVVVLPVRQLGTLFISPFQGFGNAVANLTADQESLSDLRAANEALAARNVELEEAEQTAKRLQSLLNLQSAYNLQSTGARVVANSSDSWQATITIDKGSSSGFAIGMPVLDVSGVLGQIVRCDPTSSVVRLITDENSSISAMTQENRSQGMLTGSADGTVHLQMVRTDQTVNVGDTVITSGLGGVYPKGLPLGKVSSVNRNSSSLYLEITVLPFASTDTNEEVLVVTSLTEEQEANAADITEADNQDRISNQSNGLPETPSTASTPQDAEVPAEGEGEESDYSGEEEAE